MIDGFAHGVAVRVKATHERGAIIRISAGRENDTFFVARVDGAAPVQIGWFTREKLELDGGSK